MRRLSPFRYEDTTRPSSSRLIRTVGLVASFVALVAGDAVRTQSGGVIDPTGTSPRIERLKADVARGVPGAVDQFWAEMTRQHTPIVDPVPGSVDRIRATLVWRAAPGTQSVEDMTRILDTDVWYRTFTMPRDHRLSYFFKPKSGRSSDDSAAGLPDPLNPHRFIPPVAQERPASAINPSSPFMNSSILVLPDAPASPWVDPQPGVAAGRVEERSYDSKVYGVTRRVWVYTPPRTPGNSQSAPTGLLICLWGLDYLNEIPVPTILDNLISQRRIPPLAAVFVDNTGDRFQDFGSTQQFTRSLSAELLPWARTTLHLPADPSRTIVTGYSAAGLESTYFVYRYPELIGNVLSQSGAFWRQFEGEGASEPEWLAKHYAAVPKRETRFFIDVGGRETQAAGGTFKDANVRLRDVLLRKGYAVHYVEVPGGEHEFVHWRTTFGDGLIFLTSSWGQ